MSRPRRDPHRLAAGLVVARTPRRRVMRDRDATAATLPQTVPLTMPAGPLIRTVDSPAFLVMAVVDAPGGRLTAHDRQTLGAARALADGDGQAQGAVVLLTGPLLDDAGAAGADRIVSLDDTPFDADPAFRAARLELVADRLEARHLIFPESPAGGDLARRVAVSLGAEMFAGAERVTPAAVMRPAAATTRALTGPPPRVLTLAPGRVAPHAGGPHEGRILALALESTTSESPVLSVEPLPTDPATMALGEAEFVAAAGNGVTDFDGFRHLARALGAAAGASRVVCDAGGMPRSAQVGASGTILSARGYLAFGIAGAPQHLAGIAACEHVVAVNTDPRAPMMERADLAVVADAGAVIAALVALLAQEGGQ